MRNIARKPGKLSLKRAASRVKNLFISFFKFPTIPKILLLIVVCSSGYLIYKFDQTNYFNVRNLQFSGNEQLREILINEQCKYLLGKNIFTLSVSQIEEEVKNMSIYIKNAHVEKILPDTLAINVDERTPMAVWRSVNGAYLIDKEGFILEKVVNNEIDLQMIQNNLLKDENEDNLEKQSEVKEDDLILSNEDDQKRVGNQAPIISLDEDLEKQIDWELKQREKDINLFKINFDEYVHLPDSFKKFPQVRVWSDEDFNTGAYINTEMLDKYLLLVNELNSRTFEIGEAIIFSENKVMVKLKEGLDVYFKLDLEILQQVVMLNYVYSRLRMEGIEFQEIDLRFKRPVIRE